ncbi:MAG: hypothetical protein GXO81_06790 [Chlorobi bacterium]|nr:hypothetical protein [Chlorobiota bacterium]
MKPSNKLQDIPAIVVKMVKYNMKIIFASRFIWFFLFSLGFFIGVSLLFVYNGNTLNEASVYGILLFPGIILIFYPTIFGIQNDEDAGMLEILFGIPNYRYKIWLLRLLITYLLIFILLVLFSWLSSIFLAPVSTFEIAGQLMFPVIFLGSLSFMFSSVIRNGYGTAAIMILIGFALFILTDTLERSQWNIFLNPFNIPNNFNEIIWEGVIIKNRIFLSVGIIVSILFGLYNLQRREKFI